MLTLRLSRALAIAVTLATLTPLPLWASGQSLIFDCQIKRTLKRGDWIKDTIVFVLHKNGNAFVMDRPSIGFNESATPVTVTRKDDHVHFKWQINLTQKHFKEKLPHKWTGPIPVKYDAKLDLASRRLIVRVGAQSGYDKAYRGVGECLFQKM